MKNVSIQIHLPSSNGSSPGPGAIPPAADRPRVVAKPPALVLLALGLGAVLEFARPTAFLSPAVRYPAGIAFIALGGGIMADALRRFRRAGTRHETNRPATSLVTSGPYRISRNPIYVALALVYTGAAATADSLWMLGLLAPLLAVLHYGVVLREEEYLLGKFGGEYERYRDTVRRWL